MYPRVAEPTSKLKDSNHVKYLYIGTVTDRQHDKRRGVEIAAPDMPIPGGVCCYTFLLYCIFGVV